MDKSTLSWLAIILMALLGSGHYDRSSCMGYSHGSCDPSSGAAGTAAAIGALPVRARSEDFIVERRVASQKISNGLVTLSSAAILAVYAAGYHRTGSAADGFEAQTARRRKRPLRLRPERSVAPKAATPHGVEAARRQFHVLQLRRSGTAHPAAFIGQTVPPSQQRRASAATEDSRRTCRPRLRSLRPRYQLLIR